MIANLFIDSYFNTLYNVFLAPTYVNKYLVKEANHSPELTFESKVRDKVCLRQPADEPIWIYTVFNREALRPASAANNRKNIVYRDVVHDSNITHQSMCEMQLNIALISNSIYVLEHIEEIFMATNHKGVLSVDLSNTNEITGNSEWLGLIIEGSITDFSVGDLTKEPTSEFGLVTTYNYNVTLTFPSLVFKEEVVPHIERIGLRFTTYR